MISRHFHSRNDKEMIVGWRLDLNRILHVFDVRSLAFTRRLLTIHFQTELSITTHVIVSDVHQGVSNTHVIVSENQQNVANIHRTIVTGQEGIDERNHSVSATRTPVITESALTFPLSPSQLPRPRWGPQPYIWVAAILENCLPRRRELATDATS